MATGSDAAGVLRLRTDPATLGWKPRIRVSPPLMGGVLDWTVPGSGVDAGVPGPVAVLLSEALCEVGQLSFLDPASPVRLSPPFPGRLLGRPVFPIATTGNPTIAVRLFQVEAFPWEQCAQLVVLSAPGTTPTWDYRGVFELWSASAPDLAALAGRMGVWGFGLPGVDGDFMEVAVLNDRLWERLKGALSRACGEHGFRWAEVP